jgi:hypothetical protein
MNNSYLHIFHDEKFTNTIVRQFLLTNVRNQKFIVLYHKNAPPVYELDKELPIEKVFIGSQDYNKFISELKQYYAVFIHYLCNDKLDIIDKAPEKLKIIWMCWGQDIHKLVISNSYLPKTRKLLFNKNKSEFFWRYSLWLRKLIFPYTKKGRIIKKIQYCSPVIEEDLVLINKNLNLNLKYIPFHYGWLEDILGKQINKECNSNNIFIGNSSTFASNHLDTLYILKSFNVGTRKIIVPLSYGDKKYGDYIDQIGKNLFRNNFISLRNYIPSNEYSEIISSCSIVIFNHIRQQALGNILISLWLGSKVYMNEKSLLFKNLKMKNLYIYSIQKDFNVNNKDALNKISKEQHIHNKKILLLEYGKNKVIKLTENIFNIINE